MIIPYYAREIYGKQTLYIADPATAKLISTLTGKKTVDENDIKALTALGHTLKRVDYWSVAINPPAR